MEKKQKISMDGNNAAAYIGYAMSEVACIYPITPSTPMAELCDEWSAKGQTNVFGNTVTVSELQSEAGAAGAVHGSLQLGALTTTYTASQGLLLMIPNMYKIAGEMLPCVFHVSARALASHALSIFGDHQDVMACRQTGFCMLASNNVQEAMDLALVAHLATLKASLPFLHFFDGFRTSHEINKIDLISYETIKSLLPKKEIKAFRERAHNPEHPKQTGTAQNPDIYFQNREAINKYYDAVYDIVSKTMNEVGSKTGRKYQPFMYVGHKQPTDLVISMGSSCDTIEDTIEFLNRKNKKKYGQIKVHLYRPFNAEALCKAIPSTVKRISVLDRTKEPGALSGPLALDVISALKSCGRGNVKVFCGTYGLGGKDFVPADVVSIFENMAAKQPKEHFTVSIVDDVTKLSLPAPKTFKGLDSDYYECKFFGLGSDGTVSANKSSIKIIGDKTNKYVQGYFEYDSKKSGGLTISHLRTADKPLKTPYFLQSADFIAVHNYNYIFKYPVLNGLKKNGKVLLNCAISQEELAKEMPEALKAKIKETNSELYIIDAQKVADAAGLRNRINVIMQSCFFKIANIIPYDVAEKAMKEYAEKAYSKKGQAIVEANFKAIESATTDLKKVDLKVLFGSKAPAKKESKLVNKYYEKFVKIIEETRGDSLKVSEFDPSGTVPTATTKYEKRNIGLKAPKWIPEECIQCGQCSFVCPHAAIRTYLISDEDAKKAPADFITKPAMGIKGAQYRIQVSPLDCTGCSLCANVCPAKNKALVMTDTRKIAEVEAKNFDFAETLPSVEQPFRKNTVKGVQFSRPYFEFSGACAGCGETPYVRLVTQLFGDHMIIANATGCSSIYGGSAPTCPYSTNEEGHGPSWGNSLFEDGAEFGYGMETALRYRQDRAYNLLNKLKDEKISSGLKDAIDTFLAKKDTDESIRLKNSLVEKLASEAKSNTTAKAKINEVLEARDMLGKKSLWIIGGDGWAYDIGYGGLDHVLASGANVNILVLDTEIYSNTGGQSSKATPLSSVAKFAANGKKTRKKDLGMMAISYKDVYVAQVAMGANQAQLIQAITEAESYNGPSLIIAYSPCISQGINMSFSQLEQKKAVECGYWQLYRYDPRKGEDALTIDSKDPTGDYIEFLKGENRYASLLKKVPNAEELFKQAREQAAEKLANLKRFLNPNKK